MEETEDIGYIDLLEYMKGREVEDPITVIGVLRDEIEPPKFLESYAKSWKDGNIVPVLLDLIAVEQAGFKRSFARGTVVVFMGSGKLAWARSTNNLCVALKAQLWPLKGTNHMAVVQKRWDSASRRTTLFTATLLEGTETGLKNHYEEIYRVVEKVKWHCWDVEKGFKDAGLPDAEYPLPGDGVEYLRKKSDVVQISRPMNIRRADKENRWGFARVWLTEEYRVLERAIEDAEFRLRGTREDDCFDFLAKGYFSDEMLEGIKYSAEQMASNWNETSGCRTGRAIFKDVLAKVFDDEKDRSLIKERLSHFSSTDVFLKVWRTGEYSNGSEISELLRRVTENRDVIYIALIDDILALRGKLFRGYIAAREQGVDIYKLLQRNPYKLTLLDDRFRLSELDAVARVYGVDLEDRVIDRDRNALLMHGVLCAERSTVMYKRYVYQLAAYKDEITEKEFRRIEEEGTIVNKIKIRELNRFVNKDTSEKDFLETIDGWVESKRGQGKESKYWKKREIDPVKAVEDYISTGLGVVLEYGGEEYISDYSYAKKEKYIVDRMMEAMENTGWYGCGCKSVEEGIRKFENKKSSELSISFRLEERQKEAVRLLKEPCLCITGSAGSGKTTVSEAVSYILKECYGYKDNEVLFCAPTGKAATRITEVTKSHAKTLHSTFRLQSVSRGLPTDMPIEENDWVKKAKLIVIDESSMVELDLMYEVLRRASVQKRFIFMGDIEQLAPINSGKPFSLLLRMLPTVVLNVTKRATERSGITENARRVVENNGETLGQFEDFRLVQREDADIAKTVRELCEYHLGKAKGGKPGYVLEGLERMHPDSIQIVTPINANECGVDALNKDLQEVFNPRNYCEKAVRIKSDGKVVEYRVGDRVIHLKNDINAVRWTKSKNGWCIYDGDRGVMNGEVGFITGFYSLDGALGTEKISCEEMEIFVEGTVYMGVRYGGGEETGYIITYPLKLANEKKGKDTGMSVEVNPLDIEVEESCLKDLLKHAYAATVHKLQGSQAPLVICVFPQKGYRKGFISRNLIYTAMTRASEGCYFVGDVTERQALGEVIRNGRAFSQTENRFIVGERLIP